MGMPSPVQPASGTPASAPTASDPTTAAAAASTNAPAGYTAATKVGSLAELRQKAPKLYKAMVLGIAQNMVNEMQHRQEELKKLMRKGYENS